ncbi:MAG: hypothetical protein L3J20_06230 [Flavobacteriaceae bacterium]|nr:hypothetical protein [Flavobacteriaceae bacterium]
MKKIIFVIGLTLLLVMANTWLTVRYPFFIGYVSERPLGLYQLRLVSYEVTDYGSRGSVGVDEDFGNLYAGVLVAFGKDFIYRTESYQYPFKRDIVGIIIFYIYLLSLVMNILFFILLLRMSMKTLPHKE